MSIRLSPDRKLIYVTTIDHNGIEVIDVATRKVVNHFQFEYPDHAISILGRRTRSEWGILLHCYQGNRRETRPLRCRQTYVYGDRSEAAKNRKTIEIPKEEAAARDIDYAGGSFQVSPDGKYLYRFGKAITVLQTSDFKEVDKIDLAKPDCREWKMFGLAVASGRIWIC